jgi:predicted metallopeptidase
MGQFRHEPAPDVQQDISTLVKVLGFSHIDASRVHCRRSVGSTADIYARIWELPSMWQQTLGVPPQYVLEVVAEHFDPLSEDERLKTLIHELLHIPKTFSGALRGHRGQGERIDGNTVNRYFRRYREAKEREDAGQLSLPL